MNKIRRLSVSHNEGHFGDSRRRPAYYACPLRSREAIVQYLTSEQHWQRCGWRYHDGTYLFCFNVKLHGIDLSFEHLLELHRSELPDDPAYLERCQQHYDELYRSDTFKLFDYALEDVRRCVIEESRNRDGRWQLVVSDSYNRLWAGTRVSVELGFHGRSGGWLVVERFQGIALNSSLDLASEDEIDYHTLRQLYEYIVMCSHDFSRENCNRATEHAAAWQFFERDCDEIPLTRNMIGDGI